MRKTPTQPPRRVQRAVAKLLTAVDRLIESADAAKRARDELHKAAAESDRPGKGGGK